MKRPNELAREETAMSTLVEVTSAFEGIASLRIAQTKTRVLQSTEFFKELWGIYKQLRVEEVFNFGRARSEKAIPKELYIIITAEGGFSGDIDLKLIGFMLNSYDPAKNDIIVIGHHGAIQLAQRGIEYKKYYKLPMIDQNINTMPVVSQVQRYHSTVIFYQEYVTLMEQQVKSIELVSAVENRAADENSEEAINERTYIFEPDAYAVAAHLERSMMQITISQLILSSKLAQYASRFRAMSVSRERSENERQEIHLMYNRAKRAVKDERLKEIINGIKKTHLGMAG